MLVMLSDSVPLQAGYTALVYASEEGHTQIAATLIAAGARLDLQNKVRECGGACTSF